MSPLSHARGWLLRRQEVLYPALDGVSFVLLYVYLVLAGNWVDASAFGQLNSLTALLTFLAAAGAAIQFIVARRLARDVSTPLGDLWVLDAALTLPLVLPFLLPLPEAWRLSAVDTVGPVSFAALVLVAAQIGVFRGVLQGRQRFFALWASQLAGHVARLAVLVAVAAGGATLATVWWSVIAAEVAHLVAVVIACQSAGGDLWTRIRPIPVRRDVVVDVLRVCAAQLAVAGLLSVDLILAGENLGAESGAFATANRFGRVFCFLSASVAVVLLPRFARQQSAGRGLGTLTLGAAAVSVPVSLVGAVVLVPLMRWMFPDAVVPSTALTVWELGANLGLAVIQVLVTWHVAQSRRWYAVIVGLAGVVLVAALQLGPATPLYYAQASLVVFWMTALVLSRADVTTDTVESEAIDAP